MKIPVILNCFNLYTITRAMVEWLRQLPDAKIIIVDNASTYPPLLDWYASLEGSDVTVKRLPDNQGKHAPWTSGVVEKYASGYYVVTDPDLDLSGIPTDVLQMLVAGMRNGDVCKAGLSLRLDDIPADSLVGNEAKHWEEQWWKVSAGVGFYSAAIDTTFAMYHCNQTTGDQLRAKPPYTARHIPWYFTADNLTDEYRYYLSTASSVSDWGNKMKRLWKDRDEGLDGRYVTFTFDDGDVQTAMEAHRIMEPEHATFYIVPGWLNGKGAETMDDCNRAVNHGCDADWRAIAYWGHDVGSHTMTHRVAGVAGVQAEYVESLEYIKRFGVGPFSLSFPFHVRGPVDAAYDSIRCGNSVHWNKLDVPLREVGSWTIYPEKFDEIVAELRDMVPKDAWVCFCLHGLNGRLCHPSWGGNDFMRLLDACRVLGYRVRSVAEMTTLINSCKAKAMA